MIFNNHGCGLARLNNAEDRNNFFLMVREQRWTEDLDFLIFL